MKNKLVLLSSLLLMVVASLQAQIDITTGNTGTFINVGQSFNETRGVDATVLTVNNIHLTGMALHYFNSGPDGMAVVGARIYSTSTHALLFHQDTTVYNVNFGNVVIPISYTLLYDSTYTIGFFCGGTASDNCACMWEPNSFPYVESHSMLKILHAHAVGADAFPGNPNIFDPMVTLNYDTAMTTGLGNTIATSGLNLFPNPFNNELRIENPTNEAVTFVLYDIASREIYSQLLSGFEILNTEAYSKGIYIYELRNVEGIIRRGKLIKN